MLVAGAPNEGKGCSEAFPWSPLGSRRRPPLMLESLSQVGTNCPKVQNILVAWGVCSSLTMPQPPWGGGKGSHCPDVRQLRRVWGWFFFFSLSCTQAQRRMGNTLYITHTYACTHTRTHAHTHTRTHTLLCCNFVNRIMFESMIFSHQKVSVVRGIMAKRKRRQTLVGRWQTDSDPSPTSATC